MNSLSLRVLTANDASEVSRILRVAPEDYVRFFHPFDFGEAPIRRQLESVSKDVYFGLESASADDATRDLAAFYMLRGLDEGYSNPMYGVFVAFSYRGMGMCKLTLAHADVYCRLNRFERILLKVHPNNVRAKKLYESCGFTFLRDNPASGEVVLCKRLSGGIDKEGPSKSR